MPIWFLPPEKTLYSTGLQFLFAIGIRFVTVLSIRRLGDCIESYQVNDAFHLTDAQVEMLTLQKNVYLEEPIEQIFNSNHQDNEFCKFFTD